MSVRIRELAEQALEIVASKRTLTDGQIERTWNPALYDKVFAELIIGECCAAVEKRYKYSNGTPVSFWEMSQEVQDLLKKHFGVE